MNKLAHYVDEDFRYSFMQNPDVVRNEEEAKRHGINCVTLAHFAIESVFERTLPKDLLCAELYLDKEGLFDHLPTLDDMRLGDLVWFGIEEPPIMPDEFILHYEDNKLVNWADFPVKHVAIGTGEQDERGEELLLHSTYYEGTNVVWPLSRFSLYRKYRKTYGISRLKV